MHLLALDTSTRQAALALGRADGEAFLSRLDPTQQHGRSLVSAVGRLCRQAGLEPRELEALAVGLGPGSYTGLRVGLTAAKTLAYVFARPLVGLDSLEVVAENAPGEALAVSVIGDAQRGDLYTADFRRETPGAVLVRVRPTCVEPRADWLARLAPGAVVLGPGAARLVGGALPEGVGLLEGDERGLPDPANLLTVARRAFNSGRRDDFWALEPMYLRRSAAEDKWDAQSP